METIRKNLALIASVLILTPGYSFSQETSFTNKPAQINGDFVRVRNKPSGEGDLIGMLYKNMKVDVYRQSDKKDSIGESNEYWYKVKFENIDGWCYGTFLDFTLKNGNVDVYNSPGESVDWFFKRFGYSTWEWPKKDMNYESFSLDEYRSLLGSAYSDPARVGLARSLLSADFPKDKWETAPYDFLKKILYSEKNMTYLLQMYLTWDNAKHNNYTHNGVYPLALISDRKVLISLDALDKYKQFNRGVLYYAAPELKKDKAFVLQLVRSNWKNFYAIDVSLAEKPEIYTAALEHFGEIGSSSRSKLYIGSSYCSLLKYVPAFKDNKEFLQALLAKEKMGQNNEHNMNDILLGCVKSEFKDLILKK